MKKTISLVLILISILSTPCFATSLGEYEKSNKDCNKMDCSECWNREIPEEKTIEETIPSMLESLREGDYETAIEISNETKEGQKDLNDVIRHHNLLLENLGASQTIIEEEERLKSRNTRERKREWSACSHFLSFSLVKRKR